ncbi:MAG: glutamine-dependent NAD(+) synthetase [Chaenotheca gracillima]|nr:MAG: glutamine-dependent NAD(+) synthetase [Chaenotheca gracillima]
MPPPKAARWGHNIYVYFNIRTNQTLYSLMPALNNNEALKQIPYLGKKTVPAALRKDLWQPLALLSFPRSEQGLLAYRHLREFKKMHELSWDKEDFKQEKNPNNLLSMKQRGKKLMDQKANSVADMAATLWLQERAVGEWLAKKQEAEAHDAWLVQQARSKGRPAPKTVGKGFRIESLEGIKIRWGDIHDAEFAESWPSAVIHDGLPPTRNAMPTLKQLRELEDSSVGDVEAVAA